MTELAMVEDGIVTTAATLVGSSGPIALSYSGGAESGLLLHLLRPLRADLAVVWVNPGALPHEAEHVRRQTAGWPGFVEIASDRAAAWRRHGIPTWLLPMAREPAAAWDGPKPAAPLTAYGACCARVRNAPGYEWMQANGVALVIHGQRRGEGTGLFAPGLTPAHWGPLAGWTRAEVMARVAHHGVPLPRQYGEGFPASIECAVCPADLAPDRLAWFQRHAPAEHAEAMRLARVTMEAAEAELETMRRAVAGAPL